MRMGSEFWATMMVALLIDTELMLGGGAISWAVSGLMHLSADYTFWLISFSVFASTCFAAYVTQSLIRAERLNWTLAHKGHVGGI